MKFQKQLLIVVFIPMIVFSQSLNVYEKSGSVSNFALSEIDSITFSEQSLFVCGTSQVTYGGISYNTVKVGSQCWLKENLNIGNRIQGSLNQTNNGTIEKYCYNNSDSNCDIYGGMYQWDEAMNYSTSGGKVQGICPEGWHLPTLAEYKTLIANVNNDGNALKAIGQGTGNGIGTNASGFSALLAGSKTTGGWFDYLGVLTFFWTSDNYSTPNAKYVNLSGGNGNIDSDYNYDKIHGFSVRCIKD